MRKADLVVGQAYWYQRGTTDFNHAKIIIVDLNPDPKVKRHYMSALGDKTLVGVEMIHVADDGKESPQGYRTVRSATIKGDWVTMRADYDEQRKAKREAEKQRHEAQLVARDHFNEVYRLKYEALDNLIEEGCGKRLPSTFGGADYRPLSGIPEDIVDFLLEALGHTPMSE